MDYKPTKTGEHLKAPDGTLAVTDGGNTLKDHEEVDWDLHVPGVRRPRLLSDVAVAGDFTSADTVQVSPLPDPAAADPFAYAADNPLTFTDPTGHLIAPAGSPATNPHYMDQLTYGVTYTGLVKKAGPAAAKKAPTAAVASRQALIKAGNALKAKQQKAAAAKRAAQEKPPRPKPPNSPRRRLPPRGRPRLPSNRRTSPLQRQRPAARERSAGVQQLLLRLLR